MGLDPRGVPLRARSHLARLRPERKEALRVVWGRLAALRRPAADAADAVGEWFAVHGADVRGCVLEVGPGGVASRVGHPDAVEILDPWGRGGAALVGALGPVVPSGRFDTVVAPLRGDDEVTLPVPELGVGVLVAALRPGGRLLLSVVGGSDEAHRRVLAAIREAPFPDVETGSLEGPWGRALTVRAVAP